MKKGKVLGFEEDWYKDVFEPILVTLAACFAAAQAYKLPETPNRKTVIDNVKKARDLVTVNQIG